MIFVYFAWKNLAGLCCSLYFVSGVSRGSTRNLNRVQRTEYRVQLTCGLFSSGVSRVSTRIVYTLNVELCLDTRDTWRLMFQSHTKKYSPRLFRLYWACIAWVSICGVLWSGKDGIRTRDTLLTYTRFPGVPLQPLEHLSLLRLNRKSGAKLQLKMIWPCKFEWFSRIAAENCFNTVIGGMQSVVL